MRSVAIIETDRTDRSPLEPVRAAIEAHPGLEFVDLYCGPEHLCSDADVAVVLGDRKEALDAAVEWVAGGSVLVHLHGGEVTAGCQDNRWRYAISAIADVHCVATYQSKDRLLAHGEQAERIHVTGAPGLDRMRDFVPYERGSHGIPEEPFVLCTVHPEPTRGATADISEAVSSALALAQMPVVWTAPNSDPHRAMIYRTIETHPAWNGNANDVLLEDAGTRLYLSLMHHASAMVGNSSSGIIEAPSLGCPVVNVGRRQEGRERGGYTKDVPADADAIAEAIRFYTKWGGTYGLPAVANPYAGGFDDFNASGRIADIIAGLDLAAYREKHFAC